MQISQILQSSTEPGFSFELLPPLKGKGINQLFRSIDNLMEMNPRYINITTHRSEIVYRSLPDGNYQRVSERTRPGTVAVAAAIQQKYSIPTVPHLICSGFTRSELEYSLIDLSFLGINNLLILRGDKAKHDSRFIPTGDGYSHACQLINQVNKFNDGEFVDGTKMDIALDNKFYFGVAGYPEKHDEAPNMDMDLMRLKEKVDKGAEYIVTQMFFDNTKYFDFVKKCRDIGITVPIIPGLKPITKTSQLTILPKVFHVDLPNDLAMALYNCKDDDEAKELGIEWCINQTKELISQGVNNIHFYSLMATQSVKHVAEKVF